MSHVEYIDVSGYVGALIKELNIYFQEQDYHM